jgi:hypothetical protein
MVYRVYGDEGDETYIYEECSLLYYLCGAYMIYLKQEEEYDDMFRVQIGHDGMRVLLFRFVDPPFCCQYAAFYSLE